MGPSVSVDGWATTVWSPSPGAKPLVPFVCPASSSSCAVTIVSSCFHSPAAGSRWHHGDRGRSTGNAVTHGSLMRHRVGLEYRILGLTCWFRGLIRSRCDLVVAGEPVQDRSAFAGGRRG